MTHSFGTAAPSAIYSTAHDLVFRSGDADQGPDLGFKSTHATVDTATYGVNARSEQSLHVLHGRP